MNLQLQIDELVLHGFSNLNRYQIADLVQSELTRLFAEQGVPDSLHTAGSTARLNGGTVQLAANAKPSEIGTQAANAIYRSLGGLSLSTQVDSQPQAR